MVEPCADSMRDGPRSLALASPVLAWAVIGDVSETDLPNPDYMFQPPEVSTSVAVLVVAVAVVLATCGGATTVGGVPTRPSRHDGTHGGSTIAGRRSSWGSAGRVMTARVIGANICGGIMLMFGPFIVAGLVAVSALLWHR